MAHLTRNLGAGMPYDGNRDQLVRWRESMEILGSDDIADAIAYAVAAPPRAAVVDQAVVLAMSSMAARQNSGRSSGTRPVTTFPSTTAGSSTKMPPAFFRSSWTAA